MAVSSTLPLIGPLLVRAFVDRAVAGAPTSELAPLAIAYVFLGVTRQVLDVGVVWVSTSLVWRVTNDVRVALAEHVLRLDPGFHQRHAPGALAERVDGDLTAVADYLASFVVRVVGALLTVLGAIVVVAIIDPRVAAVLAVYLGAAAVTFLRVRDAGVTHAAGQRGTESRLYGTIEEQLAGQQDLRANGAGHYSMLQFHRAGAVNLITRLKLERALLWLWHTATMTVSGGGVVSILIGTYAFRSGWISLGTTVLLFQYTQILRQPLDAMVEQLEEVQKASGGMRRVRQLLETERADPPRGARPFPAATPPVCFDGVSMVYPGRDERPVLRGVELEIPGGGSLGLMGRTGSGKTTMMRLASGLLAPTSGRVHLGGTPVWDISPDELSRHLGVVSQEVRLFAASMRDNVSLFDPSVADGRIVEVLEHLGLAERLLDRPGGLDAELDADGVGLSAGEGQLLALARVFLRDPQVVILDEATARIDPETEAELQDAIGELVRDRTALIIAHRVSTLEHVDRLAVLDDGVVVEHGTRDQLLADAGVYARLTALSVHDEAISGGEVSA